MPSASTVDEVSKISEAISQYGPITVILAVFILLFLIMVIIILKNNNKYIDQMVQQNSNLLQQVITSMPSKNYDEEDIVEIFTKLNEVFKEECKRINEKTSSSRTGIYVFHNGSIASHGLPFFKMTCVSEWITRSSGFQEQISKHTNLNLALFSSLIEELYNNGEFVISDENLDIERDIYAFMSTRAKTSIFTCVYDDDNRIMAFINSEFKDNLSEAEINKAKVVMKHACAKIQPVLEFSSYQNIKYGSN